MGGSSPWLRLDEVIALFSAPGVEPADCGAWTCPQLDFTHFKRHKREGLQVDGTERPGVPEYLGQLRTVKNLPTPTTGGAAPERSHPLLFLDFA